MMVRLLIIILCYALYAENLQAQTDYKRVYTEQKPLIFEDSEAIWPFSFINGAGQPDGYSVDVFKIIMRELDIPYEIRLKSHQQTLGDLKRGEADLILGLGDVYEERYGHYGKTTVSLLTQSVATPNGQPVNVKSFRDLKNQKVTVKDSSLCHHLMLDYGWGVNALVSHDPARTLQDINDSKQGQMVWNTLSLKWLIEHYKLGGITLTPVNMPHGDIKFISNDTKLLEDIDNTYTLLNSQGKLKQLEEKWFYPEHETPQERHAWIWWIVALALVLLVVSTILLIRELQQNYKSTRKYHHMSHELANAAQRNKMRFWTYHIKEERYEWYDENGLAIKTYTAEEFAKRYSKADHEKLRTAMDRLTTLHMDAHGHQELEETLELKAKDTEFGDGTLRDFVIHLSVLSRDSHGKPTVIIGAKKDITKEHHLQKLNTERSLRFLSMFYNNETGIIYLNKDGIIMDANTKAGELLNFDVDEVVEKHTHLNSIFHTVITDLKGVDEREGTIKSGEKTVRYTIKTVSNDLDQIIGAFVFCV